MTRTSALTCLLLAVAPGLSRAAEQDEAAGVQAAESWLKLVDGGQYGASWDEASTTFRNTVSRSAWEKKATAVREPLGKVVARTLASKQLTHELPGAPDGTYVVVTYNTKFEHKERAVETVFLTLEGGRFRGAGYFIR